MKLNAYCIFDTASGIYQRPYFVGSDNEATRAFADLVSETEHPVGKHPEDYSLFRVGNFNDVKGVLSGDDLKECIMTGLDAVFINKGGKHEEQYGS